MSASRLWTVLAVSSMRREPSLTRLGAFACCALWVSQDAVSLQARRPSLEQSQCPVMMCVQECPAGLTSIEVMLGCQNCEVSQACQRFWLGIRPAVLLGTLSLEKLGDFHVNHSPMSKPRTRCAVCPGRKRCVLLLSVASAITDCCCIGCTCTSLLQTESWVQGARGGVTSPPAVSRMCACAPLLSILACIPACQDVDQHRSTSKDYREHCFAQVFPRAQPAKGELARLQTS